MSSSRDGLRRRSSRSSSTSRRSSSIPRIRRSPSSADSSSRPEFCERRSRRGAARGVHGARRARGARDRGGRDEVHARRARRARGGEPHFAADLEGAARARARRDRRSIMGDWVRANHAFHDASIASPACRSSSSSRRAHGARFRARGLAPGDHSIDGLYTKNAEQHRAIRQALAAGSPEGARALAREQSLVVPPPRGDPRAVGGSLAAPLVPAVDLDDRADEVLARHAAPWRESHD